MPGPPPWGCWPPGCRLIGTQRGLFPLWVAWLAFSPFIVDATWTLLRRLHAGERVWQAHRSHHYQRLVLAGWGHRKTLLRVLCPDGRLRRHAPWPPSALPASEQACCWWPGPAIYALIHVRVGLAERSAARGDA